MNLPGVQANLRARLRRPGPWLAMAVFGTPFMVLRLVIFQKYLGHPGLLVCCVLTPYLITGAFAWGAPMAWRWTGDARPMAGPLRGVLQSLGWNTLLALSLVLWDFLLMRGANFPEKPALGVILWTNLALLVPTMTLVGYSIAAGEQVETERALAEAQARSARDRALQQQLSPHVLFNALNGLAELVRQDPVAAEQGILDLADLYRRVLDHGQLTWAPLADERHLVERYLAVERLRLGERLHVIWEWDEALDRLMVPPLLVQPLVENALKHGASRRPGVFKIYIGARHALGQVELTVENEGELQPAGDRRGIGMANLAQRLELHFPGGSDTFLEAADGWVKAGFHIDESALGVKR